MTVFVRGIVLVVLIGLTAPAFCLSVSYYGTPNPYSGSTPWPGGASITIPQYDPSLFGGMPLLGIQLDLAGNASGTIGYTVISGTDLTVTLKTVTTITLYRPDMSTLVVTTPAYLQVYSPVPPPSSKTDTIVGSDLDSAFLSGAGDLAAFTGTGNIVLPVTGSSSNLSSYSGAGGSGVNFTFDPSGDASVKVTYEYGDIPEPGTLALVGFGLLACGLFLKRRRSA